MQQRPGNPTSPLTENGFLAIRSRLSECQVRLTAHLRRACPKALHINAPTQQPTLGSERHDLWMAHIRQSSVLYQVYIRSISDSRQVYMAVVRSVLEYAAWASWLWATTVRKHERVQLEAARAITGLVHSTTVEAVHAEAQLPPISTRFQTISLQKNDEWVHLPPAGDRRQTLLTRIHTGAKLNFSVSINSI